MAEIKYDFNHEQGFELQKDFEGRAAWILNLTIGGQKLSADLPVTDNTGKLLSSNAVVGVLSAFSWSGGTSDPIQIKAYVSLKNKSALKLLHGKAAPVQCELKTLEYDPHDHKWFSPLEFGGNTLNGTLKELTLGDSPGSVQMPINYELDFTTAPSGINKLAYATHNGLGVVKFWNGSPGK